MITKARLERAFVVEALRLLQPLGFVRVAYPNTRASSALRRNRPWGWQQVSWEALGRPTAGLSLTIGLSIRCEALEVAVAPYATFAGTFDEHHPTLLWSLAKLAGSEPRATDEASVAALVATVGHQLIEHGLHSLERFDRGDAPFDALANDLLTGGLLELPMQAASAILYIAVLTRWRAHPERDAFLRRNREWLDQQHAHGEGWAKLMAQHGALYERLLESLG